MVTPGLDALDEEREASMADEGGWAGAVMESEDGRHLRVLRPPPPRPRHLGSAALVGALALALFGVGLALGVGLRRPG